MTPAKQPRKTRTNHKKTRYSDEEKATALAHVDANQGNVALTAKELGIPQQTLDNWHHGDVHPYVLKLKYDKTEELDVLFERVARLYLERAMQTDAVDESSGKEAVTAAAIALDKTRVIRNQPTSIQQKQSMKDDEFLHQLQRVAERLQQAKSEQAAVGGDDSPGTTTPSAIAR